MKLPKIAAATVAAVALLSACGEPVSGTVIGRDFDKAGFRTVTTTECKSVMSNGKSTQQCHPVTKQQWHGADYDLLVRLDSDPSKVRTVDVSEAEFAQYEDGDHYSEK